MENIIFSSERHAKFFANNIANIYNNGNIMILRMACQYVVGKNCSLFIVICIWDAFLFRKGRNSTAFPFPGKTKSFAAPSTFPFLFLFFNPPPPQRNIFLSPYFISLLLLSFLLFFPFPFWSPSPFSLSKIPCKTMEAGLSEESSVSALCNYRGQTSAIYYTYRVTPHHTYIYHIIIIIIFLQFIFQGG